MTSIDAIMVEWEKDAPIDKLDVEGASRYVPVLHNKYLKAYLIAKKEVYQTEKALKIIKKQRKLWYLGKLNIKEELEVYGWEPNPNQAIILSSLEEFVTTDPLIIPYIDRYAQACDKIEALTFIMKEISSRNFHIRANIDIRKFEAGL